MNSQYSEDVNNLQLIIKIQGGQKMALLKLHYFETAQMFISTYDEKTSVFEI